MTTAIWDILNKLRTKVLDTVLEVEKDYVGEKGSEKRKEVINKLSGSFDIPGVPNFIEDPIKVAAIGYLVDLLVEKINWVTGWKPWENLDDTLDTEHRKMLAAVATAPLCEGFSEACTDKADVNSRIEELYKKYNITIDKVIDNEHTSEEITSEEILPNTLTPDEIWNKCLAFVGLMEGGKNFFMLNGKPTLLPNAVKDKGGPTAYGITEAVANAAGYQINNVTPEIAKSIYRKNYYDRYALGEIGIFEPTLCLFDACVNHGAGGMAKIAQKTYNKLSGPKITVDGKWGPKTKEATLRVTKQKPQDYVTAFLQYRKEYYDSIMAADPNQNVFKRGWYNRLKNLAAAVNSSSPV